MKQWSPQQSKALTEVGEWLQGPLDQKVFYLAGFAGTGKTTLARHLAQDYWTLFAAYTGKAALVLRKSGVPEASTIHSILYDYIPPNRAKIKELEAKLALSPSAELKKELTKLRQPQFVLKEDSPIADAELLVLDECSMIDESIAKDILSFKVPILVLGDPMQLPPVKGTGYFTSKKPNVTLTEIHRQALDNPIIGLSKRVREGGDIPMGFSDKAKRIPRSEFTPEMARDASQILTGKNETRRLWNDKMRRAYGRKETYPEVGDKLICLRNDHEFSLFNGMFAEVTGVHSSEPVNYAVELDVRTELESDLTKLQVLSATFEDLHKFDIPYHRLRELQQFDYGYCITVHKSQGSQFDKVVLVDDKFLSWDRTNRTRWLYTAVTRAVDSIIVI